MSGQADHFVGLLWTSFETRRQQKGENLATRTATAVATTKRTYGLPFVISASSAGTVIEWYDFYLYATLAPFFAPIFFPSGNDTASLLSAFATYAAGFLVRPFGAVFFGALGDIIGRKYTFLVTITVMGLATVLVGFLPTYAQIGIFAPVILVALLGLTAGQGVVWYQGQFQALNFMTIYLKLTFTQAYPIMLWAVALGTPFFLVFGWLSDKIGRKIIILAGCLIAAITYLPIYQQMYVHAHVTTDAQGLITAASPDTLILTALVWIQVVYVTMVYGPIAAFLVEYFRAKVRYTSLSIPYHFGNGWFGGLLPLLFTALVGATYPEGSKSYVPFLTNFFGLPIKTNWDLRAFNSTNDPNGNPYLGLAYVITVALMTVVIGTLFLREPRGAKIWSEVGGEEPGLMTEATPAD